MGKIDIKENKKGEKRMVKGVNKHIIVLKLEDNRLYDTACFMLRRDVKQSKDSEKDMLYEANRILSEMDIKKVKPGKRRIFGRLMLSLLLLVIGACAGFWLSFLLL